MNIKYKVHNKVMQLLELVDYWWRSKIPKVGLMGITGVSKLPLPTEEQSEPTPIPEDLLPDYLSEKNSLLITPKGKELFCVTPRLASKIQGWQHKFSHWSHQVIWNSIQHQKQIAQRNLEIKFINSW